MTIVGKGSNLALAEGMKVKYKLEKKKRGYIISNVKDSTVILKIADNVKIEIDKGRNQKSALKLYVKAALAWALSKASTNSR